MNRKSFIIKSTAASVGLCLTAPISKSLFSMNMDEEQRIMPVLFMGHGNPMNAILDNTFTRTWANMVMDIPKPKAILVISAHWETVGTKITAMPNPKMIYDMYGFPEELYRVSYPCPGDPQVAREISEKLLSTKVELDLDWGLDHGAWSILTKMYPDAEIPCLQLSLNRTRDMSWHYNLGKELADLRKKGVLIVGSGNIVHNLQMARFNVNEPYDWALEFDNIVKEAIANGDHKSLISYTKYGRPAELSVNSAEHYIPMLYTLAMQHKNEVVTQYNEQIEFGSGSMRCFKIG